MSADCKQITGEKNVTGLVALPDSHQPEIPGPSRIKHLARTYIPHGRVHDPGAYHGCFGKRNQRRALTESEVSLHCLAEFGLHACWRPPNIFEGRCAHVRIKSFKMG